jgi:hypothetical protein
MLGSTSRRRHRRDAWTVGSGNESTHTLTGRVPRRWQYDLRIECCATCQPDQTRRPTKLPTPKPTMWPIASNTTVVYDDDFEEETTDEFESVWKSTSELGYENYCGDLS